MEILWRRVDVPGHEAARVMRAAFGWNLAGTAVFLHEREPVRLDYMVDLTQQWRTKSATVAGWVGERAIFSEIVVEGEQWLLNGVPVEAVTGCLDVDLNFSPSTNLLPIRRLSLDVGASAAVRAAWLRFPSFTLEPLDQTYRRDSEDIYLYTSGNFEADIRVNEFGLATEYGPWIQER